jgi:hypothetical protein
MKIESCATTTNPNDFKSTLFMSNKLYYCLEFRGIVANTVVLLLFMKMSDFRQTFAIQ